MCLTCLLGDSKSSQKANSESKCVHIKQKEEEEKIIALPRERLFFFPELSKQ